MKKIKEVKRRNLIALDLYTNGLYRHKVIQNKKKYNRKKEKTARQLIKECGSFCFNNALKQYL